MKLTKAYNQVVMRMVSYAGFMVVWLVDLKNKKG